MTFLCFLCYNIREKSLRVGVFCCGKLIIPYLGWFFSFFIGSYHFSTYNSEIFGQAVKEYNAKQKRTDRCIDDYYNKIKQDKRKYPVYECIVQIGDRSDTGIFAELEKQALIKFSEEWDKRNPNLRLIGAYIHADEPNGTVHAHIDYIPVAECTRGMRLQNSLDRALQQQGFKTKNIHQTAQIAWQDSEREALCVICKELNIDAQRNQGIGEG